MQEQINAVLSISFDRVSNKASLTGREKKLILGTYRTLTGIKKNEGCGECFVEAYLYMKQITINNKETMESKFKLHEGKRLMMHGSNDVLTNANITDDKALHILKRTPGAISLFVAYPEDWREQAQKFDVLASIRKNSAKKAKAVENSTDEVTIGETAAVEDLDKTAYEARKKNLEEKNLVQLKDFAKNLELPKDEWKSLLKAPLIEYLLDKTK